MKTSEPKPTKEEIQKWFLINLSLQTIGEDEQGNDVLLAEDDSLIDAICALHEKAMQEYANLYHKEKLRVDVPSEEEIEEFIISHPDNTGNFILGAGISAGFKVGAKWAIEQTIKRNEID